jgi:hypothetical protein
MGPSHVALKLGLHSGSSSIVELLDACRVASVSAPVRLREAPGCEKSKLLD